MPPREYSFWVYILSSRSRNLYTGVTNSLKQRTETHRKNTPGTYTARYSIHRLVYYEHFQYIQNAIAREKQLKHWTRQQKIDLIESKNQPGKTYTQPSKPQPHHKPQKQIPYGNDNKKN